MAVDRANSVGDRMADEKSKPGTVAPRQPKLRYQDRVDVGETFADSIRSCIFDGQVVRIEFTVSRFDDPGVLGILEGRQVPVSRMVLGRAAAADLFNRLGQLNNAVKQTGNAEPAMPAGLPPQVKN
jgi:hypothetical protein